MNEEFKKKILLERPFLSRKKIKNLKFEENILNVSSFDWDIVYTYLYSDIIKFFDINDTETNENIWSKFFQKDDTVILCLILNTKTNFFIEEIKSVYSYLLKDLDFENKLKALIKFLIDLLILLNFWLKNLKESNEISFFLKNIISNEINNFIKNIYFFEYLNLIDSKYIKFFDYFDSFLKKIEKENYIWKINKENFKKEKIENFEVKDNFLFIKKIKDLIFFILNKIEEIKLKSKEYLELSINTKDHKPQIGLFLSFLELLKDTKILLNELPKKFFFYYYHNVLFLNKREKKNDKIFLNFSLKKDLKNFLLKKSNKIICGKDIENQQIIFETLEDISIEKSSIREIILIEKIEENALKKNFEFKKYKLDEKSSNFSLKENFFEKLDFNCGFLISSKAFIKNHADTFIKIYFLLEENSFNEILKWIKNFKIENLDVEIEKILKEILIIEYSSKDGWIKNFSWKVAIDRENKNTIYFLINIESNSKIDFFEKNIFDIKDPAIKFSLDLNKSREDLKLFYNFFVKKIMINVQVKNFKNFKIETDFGFVDINKKFLPFGKDAKVGNSFYLSSELMMNFLPEKIALNIIWDLQSRDFSTYYQGYSEKIENESFKVSCDLKLQNSFLNVKKDIPIFESDSSKQIVLNEKIIDIDCEIFFKNFQNSSFEDFCLKDKKIKFTLTSPSIGFGFDDYINQTKKNILHKIKNKENFLLKNPYSPAIKEIFLDFEFNNTFDLNQNKTEDFYQTSVKKISYFGYYDLLKKNSSLNFFIEEKKLNDIFEVYIGIDEIEKTIYNFHFQIKNYFFNKNSEKIKLEYLENNKWIFDENTKILEDNTDCMTKSGILKILFSKKFSNENSILTNGLYWIRISCEDISLENSPLIEGIYINSVVCQRISSNNLNDKNDLILDKKSFLKFENNFNDKIKSINNPFESFGFEKEESDESFFERTQNRIFHKNRSSKVLDYEKIILENFEKVELVKCINHCSIKENSINATGKISIVVFPKKFENDDSKFFSKNELTEIKNYLKSISSYHIEIEVENPCYEKIKIYAVLEINDKSKKNSFLERIKNDLNNSLCIIEKENSNNIENFFSISALNKILFQNSFVCSIKSMFFLKNYFINEKKFCKKIKYNTQNNIFAENPWSFITLEKEQIIHLFEREELKNLEEDFLEQKLILPQEIFQEKIEKKYHCERSLENFIELNIKNDNSR
jgi:hypothetical protein